VRAAGLAGISRHYSTVAAMEKWKSGKSGIAEMAQTLPANCQSHSGAHTCTVYPRIENLCGGGQNGVSGHG
jgi:hypothetical protein